MINIKYNREFMKATKHLLVNIKTDQQLEISQPEIQKVYAADGVLTKLPKVDANTLIERDIYKCMKDRRSLRKYISAELTLGEISFLLWATQGIEKISQNNTVTFRPTPSSGARHPFETYLAIRSIEGIKPGMYRYLPITHELLFLHTIDNYEESLSTACLGQKFVGEGAVTFIWSNIPYRGEWKYNITSHKSMLIDVGHICQNLYLACETIKCGTCGIASYDQKLMDELIRVDGQDEYTVYLAPVGKK